MGSHNPILRGLPITMVINHVSKSWDDPPSRARCSTGIFTWTEVAMARYRDKISGGRQQNRYNIPLYRLVNHKEPVQCLIIIPIYMDSRSQWTLKKKFERLIFPTKYVIPKSLKFSHWPSKWVIAIVLVAAQVIAFFFWKYMPT